VNYSRPKEYTIEIIHHKPLVAVIRNFATDQECKELVKAGGMIKIWATQESKVVQMNGVQVHHRGTAGRIHPVSMWITRTEPT
jgi:hypothetical protein